MMVLEHGRAHLEELVEVIGDDAQITQVFSGSEIARAGTFR